MFTVLYTDDEPGLLEITGRSSWKIRVHSWLKLHYQPLMLLKR